MHSSSTAVSQQVVVKELTKKCQRSTIWPIVKEEMSLAVMGLCWDTFIGLETGRKVNKYQNIEKYLIIGVEHPLGE